MKKNVKILSIILMVITIVSTIYTTAYGVSWISIEAKEVGASDMTSLAGKVLGGLQVFGTLGAVIIVAVLGIKYMLASPEGKADYKSNMIPYLVGAVLLFGATNIAKLVFDALVTTK